MLLFQCEICKSNILENRMKKHHEKVHPGIDFDIYRPLTTNSAPQVASNIDTKALEQPFKHITPSADEKLVHVSCTICGNRMPESNLEQHMKRKHNQDVGDQVDAVGTKVTSMSIDDVIETHPPKQQLQEQTGWPKAKYPFSSSFRFTAIPKVDASTTTMDDDAQPFYTIRVSVAQMKQLMNENRIDPKEGHLYLK